MKIGKNVELNKSMEDFNTVLTSIETMSPSRKKEFFNTIPGKELLKGIKMVAENDKKADKQFGTTWSVEDIDELNEAIRHASPEDREILFSLLPGPVASIIHNRMADNKESKPNYSDWVKIKGSNYQDINKPNKDISRKVEKSQEGGKLIKGARKGTPTYDQWLEKIRAKRHGKVSPDVLTRPTKSSKRPFKHFIRNVKKESAKIVDKPTKSNGEKTQ